MGMEPGRGEPSPINFQERCLKHPSPAFRYHLLPAASASLLTSPTHPTNISIKFLLKPRDAKTVPAVKALTCHLLLCLDFRSADACGICFQYPLIFWVECVLFHTGEVLTPGVSGEKGFGVGSGLSERERPRSPEQPTLPNPRSFNAFNLEKALLQPRLDYGVGEGGLTNGEWRRVGLS